MTRRITTLLAVLTACSVAAAPAAASQHTYREPKIECRAKTSPYNGAPLFAATVSYTMGTRPHPKNNLRKMSLEVRLVTDTPGIDWNRTWRKREVDNVSADGANSRRMRARTNYERSDASWSVEVRMTWRRRGKNDWEVKAKVPFNPTFCPTMGGG